MSTQKTTHSHIFSVESGGVVIHSTCENLHEGSHEGKTFLTPAEAIFLSHVIAEASLPDGDSTQEAQYELVALELCTRVQAEWKPNRHTDMTDLERELHHAYTTLKFEERSATHKWYNSTFFTGSYSHDLQNALFWRYFERSHKECLVKECLPELWQSWQETED